MIDRRQRVTIAAAVVLLVAATVLLVVASLPTQVREGHLRASRVAVAVRVLGSGDRRTLEAVFTPDAPDLHLYGPDLPVRGVDGAGRPTRIEVVGGGWRSAAAAVDVQPTPFPTSLAGFSTPFSILPPGPVTVRVPVVPVPGAGEADRSSVVVAVTYMACSVDGRCFAPTEAARITVPVASP